MDPLFDKRIGAYISKNKIWTNISTPCNTAWPMSRILMFRDYLELKEIGNDVKLDYKDIEKIEKVFTGIRIYHHNPKIDEYVYISGMFGGFKTFKLIRKVIDKNNLKIKISNRSS